MRPARRPCSMLRVTTYMTAGPGIASRARLAATNRSRVETDGTARVCQRQRVGSGAQHEQLAERLEDVPDATVSGSEGGDVANPEFEAVGALDLDPDAALEDMNGLVGLPGVTEHRRVAPVDPGGLGSVALGAKPVDTGIGLALKHVLLRKGERLDFRVVDTAGKCPLQVNHSLESGGAQAGAEVVLEVADETLGASEHPSGLDHPRGGSAVGRLDERGVLVAHPGVELVQVVDPALLDILGKPVVEIAGAGRL